MTKRKKRMIIITAVTLCVAAAIVVSVLLYVHFSHKEVMTYGVPYKEIVENTTIPTKQYDNLDLSKAVLSVPEHGEFYQYYINGLDYPRYTKEETAKVARDIFPKAFELDPDKLIFGDEDQHPWGDGDESWQEDFLQRYFNVSYSDIEYKHDGTHNEPQGWVHVAQDTRFDVGYDYPHSIFCTGVDMEEEINLSKGEQLPDKAYELYGGKSYKMQEALDLANEKLENVKEYLPSYADLRASSFVVIKCKYIPLVKDENGNDALGEPEEYYQYQISYEYILDGIPTTDSCPFYFDAFASLMRVSVDKLDVEICTAGKINRIYQHGVFAVDGMEKEPLKDEFLTLESACDILSDYLAPQYMQHIDEITVKYALTWDGTVENDGDKLYLRPYWCFLKDDGYDITYKIDGEKQLLVDMQTGDIFAIVGDVYASTIEPQNDKTILQQKMDAQAPPGFFDDEE